MSRVLIVAVLVGAIVVVRNVERSEAAVPPDSVAFVSLDVAKLWEHPSFAAVREARPSSRGWCSRSSASLPRISLGSPSFGMSRFRASHSC